MGNCFPTPSSMIWGGDDWSYLTSKCSGRKTVLSERRSAVLSSNSNDQRQKPFGTLGSSTSAVSSPISTYGVLSGTRHGKMKIKIPKREFEKLVESLERHEQQGLSVNQILSRLIKVGNDGSPAYQETGHRCDSRRPELPSIPEFT